MLWLVLTLCLAFLMATKFVYVKYVVRDSPVYVVALASFLFSFPFVLALLFYVGVPPVNTTFWVALVVGGTLHAIGSTLAVKAIEITDVSLTMPLLSLTPALMLITSPIMIGEIPTLQGMLGILLIVCGAYVINISKTKESLLAPIYALWDNKGSRYVMFAAVIFSIVANIDKIGVQNSSPFMWSASGTGYVALLLVLYIWKTDAPEFYQLKRPSLWLIGAIYAFMTTFHMIAIQMTLVSYVVAIKRTSILIGIILAYLLYHERSFMERFSGAVLMVIGLVLIALA